MGLHKWAEYKWKQEILMEYEAGLCFILNSTVSSIFKVEYRGYKPALYLSSHIGIWISKMGFSFLNPGAQYLLL